MVVTGTVAEWEEWTEMALPESGAYVVPGALVPVEIDRERPKAPLGTRSNGEGLRVGGRESLRDGRSGRRGVEETGAASDESNRGHRPEPSFPRAEHGSPLSQTVSGRTKYNGG